MFQYNVVKGSRAAVITANDENEGPFRIRIWVNVLDGLERADATLVSAKRTTMQGALKWAHKELAA